MNRKFHLNKLLLVCFILPHLLQAGWHDRRCEGWAYYEEKSVPKEDNEKPIQVTKKPSEELQERKNEMEDTLAKAILEPTEENIQKYIELQNMWLIRAGDVSKVWAKVVLKNPSLDNSISGTPVSSYGSKFYHKQKSLLQKDIVKSLAESHGLICFYEGRDEASKEFAKMISLFSKRYDWIVQPISVDGVILEELPGSILDKGLKEQFGITHFPAVYVIEPNETEAIPVGFGLVSVDMIETNITLQFRENFEKGKIHKQLK